MTLLAAVAYLALFTALSWPAQDDGYTQSAHYALVRSLATGTPRVDTFYRESGDLSYWHGHYYSVKAPGVAFVALPAYAALDAVGLWPDGRRGALRLLALISSVLPALALVLLVGRVADELEPGSGLAVGLTLAVATIVMPLSTVAFSHIWSALLAFATFAVLLHERRRQARLRLVAAAGVLAGLGVLFEYPTALAGLVLGKNLSAGRQMHNGLRRQERGEAVGRKAAQRRVQIQQFFPVDRGTHGQLLISAQTGA